MTKLTPTQRYYYYLVAAERTGIHQPILAALYAVQRTPDLADGETGLGMLPTASVPLMALDTFVEQVQYAANTVRTLTDGLIEQGWRGNDLWEVERDRYSDSFLKLLADGYVPVVGDTATARLRACDRDRLEQAYESELTAEYDTTLASRNLARLDNDLLALVEQVPEYFISLAHQREALLELVRLWRQLDTREAAIASLSNGADLSEEALDRQLVQFAARVSPNYSGYPHQREALLRLVQLWRELDARTTAITSLAANNSADRGLKILDPVLTAFAQRVPNYYEGKGTQRNALTETFRVWRNLDSRRTAVAQLGIDPAQLAAGSGDRQTLQRLASQLDRELLGFIRRVPSAYAEVEHQREALIRLVQLWRELPTRERAIESLRADLRRLEEQRQNQKPVPIVAPKPPARWTTRNIQLSAPIIPNGNFTWAEATKGGTRMPPNQATVDAIVRIAKLAQRARDQIGQPFIITSWYRPPQINRAVGGVSNSRHIVGDAIDFVCENLSGNQLYWALDPWWPGGLGRYLKFPNLCHIDARNYRARWRN
ncbi:MAG: peptidase M15A [Spirulinaceae cyanobacterium SM2_1_0]|nr:peptidase M15A [Spirulinaceae cyanobacterium SM2_1_0]